LFVSTVKIGNAKAKALSILAILLSILDIFGIYLVV
jgi:hypothetical protein